MFQTDQMRQTVRASGKSDWKQKMRGFLNLLRKFEELVAVCAYTIMFGMIFAEIVMREAFGETLFGSEEIAIICSVIAGFVGFSLVTQSGSHLRANFLDRLMPMRFEPFIVRFANLLSAVLFCGLAVISWQYVQDSIRFGDRIPVLYWKLWPFQIVVVYALGVSALKHLIFFLINESPGGHRGH